MKNCPLFLLFIFLWSTTGAQNFKRIGELKQEVQKASATKKFDLLNDLAWEYRFAMPDSTLYYAQQALKLGEELKLNFGLARPLNFIGVGYVYKGDKLTAYQFYNKALDKATEQIDSLQIAYSQNNLGRLLFDQGLLARSYPYFVNAVALFDALNDSSGMAYGYQSLASLYRTQKDFKKAEEYYVRALKLRIGQGVSRNVQAAYTYLGRLYTEMGELKKSTACFLRADSASSVINDEINIAEIKTLIAENYLREGKVQEAEKIFKQGYDVILRINSVRLFPRSYLVYGDICLRKGDLVRADKNYKQALAWARKNRELETQMEAHLQLSKVAAQLKNTQEELSNYNQYLLIKDSLSDLDVARQVERLQFEVRIQQEEQENDSLKLEKAEAEATITQQRLQNITLVVVALSLLVVGTVISITSRKRREANTILAKQNVEIENQRIEIIKQNQELAKRNQLLSDLNQEKDTLMSIVAHDLKSPLNRIRGLVTVMRLEGGLDDEKVKLLKMMEDSTQAGIDLITDLLDVHEIEENKNFLMDNVDVQLFLQQRIETFRSMAIAKGIDIKLYESELRDVHSNNEYLNRIFDNLISNSIKFSSRGSVIHIRSGVEHTKAWISVRDEGPGFQEFDKKLLYQKFKRLSARPTGGESSNGLGLAIVKTLIDRLKGEIILNTAPGKGSEFVVKLPM